MRRHGYTEQELRAMTPAKIEIIVQTLTGHRGDAVTTRRVSRRRKKK